MAHQIFKLPKAVNLDAAANVLPGSKAYFYATTTTTPQDTYTTSALSVANPNPVVADANGVFSAIYLDPTLVYKLTLKTSADVLIYTIDPVNDQILSQAVIGQYLYPRTSAEVSVAVTPTNYAYQPELVIDARRYGVTSASSASFNATAINSALSVASAAGGGTVQLPPGDIPFDSTLNIGTRVFLRGLGKGYGVSSATVLRYTGSGIGIQIGTSGSAVSGFYSGISDLALKNDGTGTIGVRFSSVHGTMRRVTITAQTSVGWSTAGFLTDTAFGTYTFRMTECYITDNALGADFTRGQDFKLVNCYFERNGKNIRVGGISTVIGFAMFGGVNQLLGPGYSGDTNETNSGIGLDVVDCRGFEYAGVYGENNGGAIAAAAAQRCIVLRTCRGGSITGSNFYGAGVATGSIHAEANARGVVIEGNHFNSFNGYAVTRDSGAMLDVGINNQLLSTGIVNNAWTPVPTSLTVVNGTGGATYSGTWDRKGNRVFFTVRIVVTGTATTASTANTTYFAIDAAMPSVVTVDANYANSDAVDSYGVGLVFTNGRIYTPTWAAANKNITISGSYLTSDAT